MFELTQDLAERWGLDKNKATKIIGNIPFKEASLLKLNCDKALSYLNWHSTFHYDQCVSMIADWYKAYYLDHEVDMFGLTERQIAYYMSEAAKENLAWAL